MKKIFFLFAAMVFFSCGNNSDQQTDRSENDADAARNFIRAALDGRWKDARKYLVQDSTNIQLIERAEEHWQKSSREERRSYREASIRFYDTRLVNDSTSVLNYSNTFRNQRDSLKAVRINGEWLIDLKYSLLPTDTTDVY